MPALGGFGFQAMWSPFLIMLTLFIAVLYLYIIGPMRVKFKDAEPVPISRQIWFFIGLFCLYMAIGGPLDLLGHLMFSYHMFAMAVAFLAAPPLILLGLPAWLLRPLFQKSFVKKSSRILLNPILALFAFNGLFSLYHIPVILDFVMTNYAVHTLFYAVLLLAAFMMWWQVVSPIPELASLTDLKKMGYIFANGVLLTPACGLIIFANEPLFKMYSDPAIWAVALGYCVPGDPSALLQQFGGPGNFNLLSPKDDQQLGGIVMKLMQELMYGSILAYVFFQWFRKENPDQIDDVMDLAELEKNLNKA